MSVLVTGATGTIGREVVRGLLERGVAVRALTRDPATAHLDPRVEVVAGDLTDLDSLDAVLPGVTAAHLITFTGARGQGGGEPLADGAGIVERLNRHQVQRVSVLHGGGDSPVQSAVTTSPLAWTVLQPVEFMANLRSDWAEPIRTAGRVAEPYPDRRSAMVHEGDVGDVAAVVLTEDGHAGQTYTITGPQVLTLRDKLDAVGRAIGRELELVGLSEDEALERWRASGLDEETIGFLQWVYGDPPEIGFTVTDTVPTLLGRSARTIQDWADEHAEAFRTTGRDADRDRDRPAPTG